MRFEKLFTVVSFSIFFLTACNKVEYHPYDGRINGKTGINKKNIVLIEKACAAKDTIRFAVISDTQGWLDETARIVKSINSRQDVDFTLHLGDLSDFGLTKEFEWQRDCLEKLACPYVCLIGNHDCLATGEYVFKKIFGDINFAFTTGKTRFVCLNTNSREFDHTTSVPDFSFIKEQQEIFPAEAVNTVAAMHAPPTSEQFDNNISPYFEYELLSFPNLLCCIHGHNHHNSAKDLFSDGNIYYGVASASKLSYYIFTVFPEGYSYETIDC